MTDTPSQAPDEAGVVELLPCPFCGKLPRECPDNSYGEARVYCPDDNDCAIAPMASADLNDCEDISDARRHWNTRALSPPPVVEEAGLREVGHELAIAAGELVVAADGILCDERQRVLNAMTAWEEAILAAPTPPAGEAAERLEGSDSSPVRRAIVAAEQAALEAYLGEYVMSTEGPDYEPTEWERWLIEDALQGYLVDREKAVREALAALPIRGLTIPDELREKLAQAEASGGSGDWADLEAAAINFIRQALSNRKDSHVG